MIAQNENPLSSLMERTKTEHPRTERGLIRLAHHGDKGHSEGADRAQPIFRIEGSKSCYPTLLVPRYTIQDPV
jgi:hypothetical protein